MGSTSTPPPTQQAPANGSTAADDDFTFSSALPDETPPSANTLQFGREEIGFTFAISRREGAESIIDVEAKFSNFSTTSITDFTFQIAVTKVILRQSMRRTLPLMKLRTGVLFEADSAIWSEIDASAAQWHHAAYGNPRRRVWAS
jgi:hypothetical protein